MKIITQLAVIFVVLFVHNLYGQDKIESMLQEAEGLKTTGVISVSIGGDFFINGTFSAFATERLDHFLTRILYASIGGSNSSEEEKSQSTSEQISSLLDQTVKRNIKFIRADGSVQLIDLEKYYLTGDISQNPYLKMDDMIIFPKVNMETSYIIVDGAVNKKLKFPFIHGDKLSDALLFAHGVDEAYHNVESAEIVRLSYDGNTSIIDTVSLDNAESYLLQAGDVIQVLGENYERKDYKVLIVGEINKPGYVFITKANTTLRDVINKAGGLKNTAWLERSELIRANTPEKKVFQELVANSYLNGATDKTISDAFKPNAEWENWKMFRTANLFEDYNNIFRLDAQLAIIDRNNLVDFTKLTDTNAKENDFVVNDGDVIFIADKVDLVYVMGQVANPGYYAFTKGSTYEDYIMQAGGFSESADDEVFIIKGKSDNWISADDYVTIEPGDYIWVNKDQARSFNFYLTRVSAVTGIIGSIATILLLIKNLK